MNPSLITQVSGFAGLQIMCNFIVFNIASAKPLNTWVYEYHLGPGSRHSVTFIHLMQRGGAIIHAWV